MDLRQGEQEWQLPLLEKERKQIGVPLQGISEILVHVRRREGRHQRRGFLLCLKLLEEDGRTRELKSCDRVRVARIAVGVLDRAKIGTSGSRLSSLHDELFHAVTRRIDLNSKSEELIRAAKALSAKVSLEELTHARWRGDLFQAEALLEELSKTKRNGKSLARERALLEVARDLEVPKKATADLALEMELGLWRFALPKREGLKGRSTAAKDFLPLRTLESCYDVSLPKPVRWEGWIATWEAHEFENPFQGLLYLAASARWCIRNRDDRWAKEMKEHYERLSLALSRGESGDVLGVFHEELNLPLAWERFGALSNFSFDVLKIIGRSRFAALFGREEQRKRLKDLEVEQLIAVTTKHLSRLRGPLMKVGQTASYFGLGLGPLSGELLAGLQDSATPMPVERVLCSLECEWGQSIDQVLSEFDEVPIGVGSVGQVHRGRLKTGERVAIKVRHEGIQAAIRQDVFLLRVCFPVIQVISARAAKRSLLDELEGRLLEECDYKREATLMENFREFLADMPALRIPRVFPDWCREGVLVTELIEAKSFKDFVATASQEEKNRAGSLLSYYVVRNCCRGTFNSDPHPGNFLFGDGVVYCLDFGGVKVWDRKFSLPWAELILAGVTRDYPLFAQSIEKMGIVADRRNFDMRRLYEVYSQGSMNNAAVDLPTKMQYDRLHAELTVFSDRRQLSHSHLNPEYLYGIRVYTGLISILAALGAEINFHDAVLSICKKEMLC